MADIVQKRPRECSDIDLDAFEGLVKKGGEVACQGLRGRIMKAEWLVFLFEMDRTLAGVAALKKSDGTYKKEVFAEAKSEENPDDSTFEAGWVFVEEQFRGKHYSRLLLDEVLRLADKKRVYATTRHDNKRMRQTNRRCGLKESGFPYTATRGNYRLILYTNG